jgi:murein DD-endopeptidase MepM/ murein hydrolase activator NlpD
MNHRRGVCSLFLLITVLAFSEDAVHVVGKGETVYSISRSYRISPGELMRYNNIADATRLQIGQRLKIPAAGISPPPADTSPPQATASGTPAASGVTEYRVVKNDTLYSIARRQGISLQALLDMNGFSANHTLREGERIKVPQGAVASGTATSGTSQSAPARVSTAGTQGRNSGTAVRQTAAAPVDASLRWPVKPKELAYMTGKLYGVVVTGDRSESVKSLTQGTVVSAGPYRGFGRVAIVQVAGGYLYVYGGCESLSVKEGDRIGPGTELGKLGIDAVSQKPQLFFLVYRSNSPIDPATAPRA